MFYFPLQLSFQTFSAPINMFASYARGACGISCRSSFRDSVVHVPFKKKLLSQSYEHFIV
jgi:hypothetical protein